MLRPCNDFEISGLCGALAIAVANYYGIKVSLIIDKKQILDENYQ